MQLSLKENSSIKTQPEAWFKNQWVENALHLQSDWTLIIVYPAVERD